MTMIIQQTTMTPLEAQKCGSWAGNVHVECIIPADAVLKKLGSGIVGTLAQGLFDRLRAKTSAPVIYFRLDRMPDGFHTLLTVFGAQDPIVEEARIDIGEQVTAAIEAIDRIAVVTYE